MRIAAEYNLSAYTRQRLELLDRDVQSLFPVTEVKQKALSDYM
jgi:DNA polymerase II large subunit